jgi:hypothetical protein
MRDRFERRWYGAGPSVQEGEDPDELTEQDNVVANEVPEGVAEVVENAQNYHQPTVEDSDDVPPVLDPVPEAEDDATFTSSNFASSQASRPCRQLNVCSPATRRQDQLDAVRDHRELVQFQRSQVLSERPRLEQKYGVTPEARNIDSVKSLGGMRWPLIGEDERDVGEVRDAFGYTYVAGTAIFYHFKT